MSFYVSVNNDIHFDIEIKSIVYFAISYLFCLHVKKHSITQNAYIYIHPALVLFEQSFHIPLVKDAKHEVPEHVQYGRLLKEMSKEIKSVENMVNLKLYPHS
jgi:hypothetical protein